MVSIRFALILLATVSNVDCTTGQESTDMHHLARLRAMILKVKSNSAWQRIQVDRSKLHRLEDIFISKRQKRKSNRMKRYTAYHKSIYITLQ